MIQQQIQNTQILQLLTKIIKAESVYKSYTNAKHQAWVQRPVDLINMGEEVRVL